MVEQVKWIRNLDLFEYWDNPYQHRTLSWMDVNRCEKLLWNVTPRIHFLNTRIKRKRISLIWRVSCLMKIMKCRIRKSLKAKLPRNENREPNNQSWVSWSSDEVMGDFVRSTIETCMRNIRFTQWMRWHWTDMKNEAGHSYRPLATKLKHTTAKYPEFSLH
jgi:hypothetical protein